MKYICLGFIEKGKREGMTRAEQHAMYDESFEYVDHLRANGHFAGGEALQPSETALTRYWKNGKVAATDGPYADTREQLGGIGTVEARDLNLAVQLMAQHPALKYCSLRALRRNTASLKPGRVELLSFLFFGLVAVAAIAGCFSQLPHLLDGDALEQTVRVLLTK